MGKKRTGDLPGQQVIQDDGSIGQAPTDNSKAPPLTPRQRFIRHAGRRTAALLKRLKHFGNMADRKSYGWTDAERDELIEMVRNHFDEVVKKFNRTASVASERVPVFSWERPAGADGGANA